MNPAASEQWQALINENSIDWLPDLLHDDCDKPLYETEMAFKFHQKVELINKFYHENLMTPPKLVEICAESWTAIPGAIDE